MKKFKSYSLSVKLVIMLLVLTTGQIVSGQGVRQIHLIMNPKPTVNFGVSTNSQPPMTANFSDSSSIAPGSVTSWVWNFGDGNTSNIKNPIHTYSSPGFYNVTLTATSQAGCEASLTKTVLIENSGGISIAVNNPIQCSSGNSFTYTGTGIPSSYTYLWDFGDGGTSTSANPTHNYATSGTFNIRLIVSATGQSTVKDTAYLSISVVPTPNVFGINHVYCSGEQVPAYYFTGNLPGTVYKWNRILGQDIGIGLTQTSGVDSIPAFTAQNTGIQYLSPIYHVTPYYTADGLTCAGTGENFLMTVNPVPKMSDVIDRVYTNGQTVPTYIFTGNSQDANYSWRYLSGDVLEGIAATGDNQIPSFVAVNTGNTPLKALYEAVPDYTYANKTCIGIADTFSITILPNSSISFTNRVQICASEPEAMLLCVNKDSTAALYHKVTFGQKALEAGFINMNDFALLPSNGIHIAIPSGVEAGMYAGHLYIKRENAENYTDYDFAIDIIKTTRITQHLNSRIELCNTGGAIHLEVAAEGANLSYQWYKNGTPIAGATTAVYEKADSDSSDFGIYEVAVTGDCGTEMSKAATVVPSSIVVLQKWDDMIFVSNRDSLGNKREIKAYQWYRVYIDGSVMPINDKGQSQYYSEKDMQGTFAVEVTFADGSKQMSCPYTMIKVSKAVVKIYPNPGKSNERINVLLDLAGSKTEGSKIEIFDELGKLITQKTATGSITEFYLNVPSATYVFKITEPNGHITTQKVIIN